MLRRALVLSIAAAVTLVGCSGSGDKSATPKSSTTPKETTTTAPPRVPAPLTGELVSPEIAGRAAVSVKVNNTREGGVQAGIDKADVLFEERVEGGFTRFVAVFQSRDADLVGPIRSIRPTDPALVWPFGGVFTFSDGVPQVVRLLRGVPVKPVYEMQGGAPFTYPRDRNRPFKTFASTQRLRQEAPSSKAPPSFAPFLAAGAVPGPGDGPAASATVTFGTRTSSSVQWDAASGRWLKSANGVPQIVSSGARLAFASVIIQFVRYSGAGYRDVTGSMVDKADLVGAGEGILLINGQKKAIRWSKPSGAAMTAYTDATGAPVSLPAGPVLVMLPAPGSPVSIT